MKNILVLIHDDAGLESRLGVAIGIARTMECQLICLDITIPTPVAIEPLVGSVLVEPEVRGAVQVRARHQVEQTGIAYRWLQRDGDLAAQMSGLSDLADLAVISAPRNLPMPDMFGVIGKLLVKAKRRVLTVPTSCCSLNLHREAMLLWDGSVTAHNAMVAAKPLLRLSAMVTILEVDDGSLGTSAIRASEYLSEHDIPNTVRSIAAMGERASYPILEQIERLKPQYVAMGGYGHSRFMEGLFGGVTDRLLREAPVPLLLKN